MPTVKSKSDFFKPIIFSDCPKAGDQHAHACTHTRAQVTSSTELSKTKMVTGDKKQILTVVYFNK